MMEEYLCKRPEVNPIATCSSSKGLLMNNVNDDKSTSSPGCSQFPSNNLEFASSISKKRKAAESAVNKRHSEKMQRMDRYLEIVDKYVSTLEKKSISDENQNN
jgi:hypothetical protein